MVGQGRHGWDDGPPYLRVYRDSGRAAEEGSLDRLLTEEDKQRLEELMQPSEFGDSWARAEAIGLVIQRAKMRQLNDACMVRTVLNDMQFYRSILTWEELMKSVRGEIWWKLK